jgi:hypothetical protein
MWRQSVKQEIDTSGMFGVKIPGEKNRYKNSCPVCGNSLENATFLLTMAVRPTSKRNAKVLVTTFCNSCGTACGGTFSIPQKVFEGKIIVGR